MEIVLKIEDGKVDFFLDLIKNFKFVKILKQKNDCEKEEILNDIKEGIEQIKLHQEGKIKLKSLDNLLIEN